MPSARVGANEAKELRAGDWGVHDSEAADADGKLGGESVGDHETDVVTDDVDGGEVESVQKGGDISGDGGLGVGARFGGGLDTWEVDENEIVSGGEEGDGAVVGGPGLGPAVEEEERGTCCVVGAA